MSAATIMKAVTAATKRIVDFFIWWAVRDLNPRPPARHAGALAN